MMLAGTSLNCGASRSSLVHKRVTCNSFKRKVQNKDTRAASNNSNTPCILVTNDDGIESAATQHLARQLKQILGYRVVVLAPRYNKSAASMALTLRQEMSVEQHQELGDDFYSLVGGPADCSLVALDPLQGLLPALGLLPLITVSGPNYGYNISNDVLHSGTVGAARMAAQMGVPALAASGVFADKSDPLESVVAATVELAGRALDALQHRPATNWPRNYSSPPSAGRRYSPGSSHFAGPEPWEGDELASSQLLLQAFQQGDVYLNLNVPPTWQRGGQYHSTGLGLVYYLNYFETTARQPERVLAAAGAGANASGNGGGGSVLPASYNNKHNRQTQQAVPGTDVGALQAGAASVSTLQAWPEGHPLGLRDALMAAALREGGGGMPCWLD